MDNKKVIFSFILASSYIFNCSDDDDDYRSVTSDDSAVTSVKSYSFGSSNDNGSKKSAGCAQLAAPDTPHPPLVKNKLMLPPNAARASSSDSNISQPSDWDCHDDENNILEKQELDGGYSVPLELVSSIVEIHSDSDNPVFSTRELLENKYCLLLRRSKDTEKIYRAQSEMKEGDCFENLFNSEKEARKSIEERTAVSPSPILSNGSNSILGRASVLTSSSTGTNLDERNEPYSPVNRYSPRNQ